MPSSEDEAPPAVHHVETEEAPKPHSLVLCHPGPSHSVPSLSLFVLKLETYLRMADIPYTEEISFKKSSKGKIPFIKHNGKEVTDTSFIIAYLKEQFGKDLNESLNDEQKAIALAFKRLIEENAYWGLVHYRWIENWPAFSKMLPITGVRRKLMAVAGPLWFKPSVKSNLHGHGIGRHSNEEIRQILEHDIRALSTYLGTKQFFMGDEPTEIDASVFGFIAQIVYAAPGSPAEKLVKENLQNLSSYADRMRERYWGDWDKKVLPEKKKEEPAPAKNEESAPAEENPAVTNGENEANGDENAASDQKNEDKIEDKAPAEENGKAGDAGDGQPQEKTEDKAEEEKEQ